jgi:hypothetical protein
MSAALIGRCLQAIVVGAGDYRYLFELLWFSPPDHESRRLSIRPTHIPQRSLLARGYLPFLSKYHSPSRAPFGEFDILHIADFVLQRMAKRLG